MNPSITTGRVMFGSAVAGEIVCGPGPGMSKLMAIGSGSAAIDTVFAAVSAARSDPGPESAVVFTVNAEGGAVVSKK